MTAHVARQVRTFRDRHSLVPRVRAANSSGFRGICGTPASRSLGCARSRFGVARRADRGDRGRCQRGRVCRAPAAGRRDRLRRDPPPDLTRCAVALRTRTGRRSGLREASGQRRSRCPGARRDGGSAGRDDDGTARQLTSPRPALSRICGIGGGRGPASRARRRSAAASSQCRTVHGYEVDLSGRGTGSRGEIDGFAVSTRPPSFEQDRSAKTASHPQAAGPGWSAAPGGRCSASPSG